MASITRFLADTLKRTVNASKRAVASPWTQKFPGYSRTGQKVPRLKIALIRLTRLEGKIRAVREARAGGALGRLSPNATPSCVAGSGTRYAAFCGGSGNGPILAPST